MATSIAAPQLPLQSIIPSYLYQQYADDPNLQAFIDAFNTLSQTYLTWFNASPLALYTSPNISGQLLDWIGQGIYGIQRPIFASLTTFFSADVVGENPPSVIEISGTRHSESGTATIATDDYYKRVLTWHTYIGDSRYTNATVIRKRVARFLFGVNGTDITLAQSQAVSVAVVTGPPISYTITIPASTAATYFKQAFESGILAFPFMLNATVVIV